MSLKLLYLDNAHCKKIYGCKTYSLRSKRNVDESDGTIVFRLQKNINVDKIIGYCLTKEWKFFENFMTVKTQYKPCLVINNISESNLERNICLIQNFIIDNEIKVLNVAGHRNNESAGTFNFEKKIKNLLLASLYNIVVKK